MTCDLARLGIDVGGTHTDAVLLDTQDRLLAKAKVSTTPDVGGGVRDAITAVLAAGQVTPDRITHAMLGTTQVANALLEASGLRRVAVLRIGAPAGAGIPPLAGWPHDLRTVVSAGEATVAGGVQIDGRPLAALDVDATRRFFESVREHAEAVAVTAVFADISADHEIEAGVLAREILGDLPVTLSHEIGSLGLIERENATVLNAGLGGIAAVMASTLQAALRDRGVDAAAFFAQNDGALMALEYALRYPVLTIGSGTANSMRGAAHLSDAGDAIVVDAGGTSTDIGCLVGGFPRESTWPVDVGGIRTNFRMPDLISLPVGGGSIIRRGRDSVGVGPGSVGYRLAQEALSFGGSTPTLTDAAVALHGVSVPGASTVPRQRPAFVEALRHAEILIADAIDRVKVSRHDQPLIAAGGASFLVSDEIPGVSEVLRPEHHEVANAVGAAIAPVAGYVDRIFRFVPGTRQAVIDEACDIARGRAIRAGADPLRTEIVDIEQLPVAYISDTAARVRVKATGPLGAL